MDPIDTQVELRAAHSQGKKWYGVGASQGKVEDMEKIGVYEPAVVKRQVMSSATEAACMILRIDDVIASTKMREPRGGAHGGEGAGMGED